MTKPINTPTEKPDTTNDNPSITNTITIKIVTFLDLLIALKYFA